MNKVEAQQRIVRNLAVIRYQVELLARHGQNISIYTETAIADSLTAVTGQAWANINATHNNYPALDLLSSDGVFGVQATAHTTKAKLDKTIHALVKELGRAPSRLSDLQQVEVVGLTCVASRAVTSWQTVEGGTRAVKVRGVALEKLLNLPNRSEIELTSLDRTLQDLASTSPFHLRSDQDELRTILAYLDRPAIRDHRKIEMDWQAMQDAMVSIRRLLGQGANDLGQQITRPYATFQPVAAGLLREIYMESSEISVLLRDELHSPGSMRGSDWSLLEGHRLRIQEKVTELAAEAQLTPPLW
jgi:hypothetical protein